MQNEILLQERLAAPSQPEHFSFGQVGAVFMCAIVLAFVSLMKGGFVLPWDKAEVPVVQGLTFEEVKKQVFAKYDLAPNANRFADEELKKSSDQLAMIDPSLNAGAVLGDSTGTIESLLGVTGAEEIFTPEMLAKIPVKTISETSALTIQKYVEDVAEVESYYDAVNLISVLGGEDPNQLQKTSQNSAYIMGGLSQVEVPKGLEEYHRYKIIFYAELSSAADFYLKKEGAQSMDKTSAELFSVKNKLDAIQEKIYQEYNIQL